MSPRALAILPLAMVLACGSPDEDSLTAAAQPGGAAAPAPAAPAASAAPALAASAASSAPSRWVAARPPGETALLEAPAQVVAAPEGRAAVAPPLRARIVAVRAHVGETVAAGAPLVDVALPEAAVAAAEHLAAADQIAAHERRIAHLEELRREGLARTGDIAALELELARLRGARELAATTLRAAGFAIGEARALATSGGRVPLRAPIAGVVTRVAAIAGASASPDAPLVELASGGARRIEARLPRALPPDARLDFLAPGRPGGAPIAAALVSLAPVQEPDGTTRAWLDLAEPLAPGTAGRLLARIAPGAAALVPASAIDRDAAGAFVWRRGQPAPKRVPVRVLATSGADALVEGIAAGDEIAAIASALREPP